MALTTDQLRDAWAPHCTGPWATVSLNGYGKVTVRGSTVEAVLALNACLVAWKYQTRKEDTGAYNCRPITGGTDWSLHAYGIASDLNWQTNPYGPVLITDMPKEMVAAIKAIKTRNGKQVLGWGGDYSKNKDAMHWEVIVTPADLASGIDWSTVAGEEADMTQDEHDLLVRTAGDVAETKSKVAAVDDRLTKVNEYVLRYPDPDEVEQLRADMKALSDKVWSIADAVSGGP